MVAAFEKANPGVTVKTETRPGGTEGDNLVKTKLSTGDDGRRLLVQLRLAAPGAQPVPDAGRPHRRPGHAERSTRRSCRSVTQGGKVYGAPWGTAIGGGILYNKDVYSKLGLQIPKTWAEFEANNDKIKAAGITPVIETFKAPDTWTSQLFVLGDYYNVQLANPNFAKDYTANKVKYATDPAAVKGFQKLAEVKAKGYVNSNYGSATLARA